jgi:hypothetical protein
MIYRGASAGFVVPPERPIEVSPKAEVEGSNPFGSAKFISFLSLSAPARHSVGAECRGRASGAAAAWAARSWSDGEQAAPPQSVAARHASTQGARQSGQGCRETSTGWGLQSAEVWPTCARCRARRCPVHHLRRAHNRRRPHPAPGLPSHLTAGGAPGEGRSATSRRGVRMRRDRCAAVRRRHPSAWPCRHCIHTGVGSG